MIPPSLPKLRLFFPLLLVCLACAGCAGNEGAGHPRAGSARATIEAVGPKGAIRFPFSFEWKTSGVDPDSVFRLTLYDEAERQIFERDTRVSRFEAPDDLKGLLASTPRFLWRVAVVDGSGNVVARTDPVEATVVSRQ